MSKPFPKQVRSLSPPLSPSPSPSPGSPAPPSEFTETFGEIWKNYLPKAISVCNGFCGLIAAYFGVLGNYSISTFFVVLGFVIDAANGPIAKFLESDVNYFESLADVVTFGIGGGVILMSYFQKNNLFWVGVILGLLHLGCSLTRLGVFLTEGTPPGIIRGLPAAVGGIMVATACSLDIPYKWIIGLTVAFSFFMVALDTVYIKPLSVKNIYLLGFVWLLHFLAPIFVIFIPVYGTVVVASVAFLYGAIPVINRFYRWLFKHSKYPGEFDYCLTMGVYDMFHQGHYELFAHMSAMARKLLVGVHDDQSVFDLKNVRVTDPLEKRMDNIRKLRRIRKVFPCMSTDPSDTIRKMLEYVPKGQTVCFMRGDDWQDFPGRPVLEERQVPIIFHHYTEGVSSSLLRLARERHTI